MANAAAENMSGKICLVTGASTGIGKEIARGLAQRGATVVIAVRNVTRGEQARAEIVKETKDLDVTVMQLDVSSLANIRDFSERFHKHHDKLHVLVNNAGGWQLTREVTPEGFENIWATNVLGPYLLTESLLDLLKAGAPSRVVNVASTAAGGLDLSDVQYERRKFSGFNAYSASKQALRMLTWSLAKRLEGTGVTANSMNPGFVKTELNRNVKSGFLGFMMPIMQRIMAKTPEQGADTALWCAVDPSLEKVTGRFFSDRKDVADKFIDPPRVAELDRLLAEMVKRA